MLDPTFWATALSGALQIPSAIKALRDLAKGEAAPEVADEAYCRIVCLIQEFGQTTKVMKAWKHAHNVVQNALDSYDAISRLLQEHGKQNAIKFVADVGDEWASYRRNDVSKLLSDFSGDELSIVGTVSLGPGQSDVDWLARVREIRNCVDENMGKSNKVEAVYRELADFDVFLRELLNSTDRELRETCGQFSDIWIKMQQGF